MTLVKKESSGAIQPSSQPQKTSQEETSKYEEILKSAISGTKELELTEEEKRIIFSQPSDDEIEIKPDGEIYVPSEWYRSKLRDAFGLKWSQVPLGDPKIINNTIYWEFALVIKGVVVATAIGQQKYIPENQRMDYGDALEGAKSNALKKLCKSIGMASNLWNRKFIDEWIKKYAGVRKVERKGRIVEEWYKKETPPEEKKTQEESSPVVESSTVELRKKCAQLLTTHYIHPDETRKVVRKIIAKGSLTDQEVKDLFNWLLSKMRTPDGKTTRTIDNLYKIALAYKEKLNEYIINHPDEEIIPPEEPDINDTMSKSEIERLLKKYIDEIRSILGLSEEIVRAMDIIKNI